MYNYDFNDEFVLYEFNDYLVSVKDKELYLNILITNKNLLLFYDNSKDFIVQKSQGVFVNPNYDLILKLNLNNINHKVVDENSIINDNIIIYNFDIKKYFGD